MSAAGLVREMEQRGAILALVEGVATVDAPEEVLTPEVLAILREHRDDIAHLLLERQAAAVFPGAVVVNRADYLEFRHRLLTDITEKWSTAEDRWHHFWLAISAGLTEPEPLPTWCNRLAEERMPAYVAHQDERFAAYLDAEGLAEDADEEAA